MKAKKYYAVKVGKKTGIFTSWEDCEKQVLGFKNAEYKSFSSKKEAQTYLLSILQIGSKEQPTSPMREVDLEFHEDDVAIAYSDGSYNPADNTFSFGTLIIWKGLSFGFSQRFDDEKLAALRNVSGEIIGAKKAMKFAYDNNIKKLQIHHDYEGVAAWAKRDWQANNDVTQNYQKFYDEISKKVVVEFIWVKGHSGNRFNDLVDKLAKEATFTSFNQKGII